jgi:hypothetical protein
MGKYDDITPDQLKAEIRRFAGLLIRMEEEGVLLERTPAVLQLLGELRQMLFAYEVRHTQKLLPEKPESAPSGEREPMLDDSRRIVEDALRREKELQEELERRLFRGRLPDEE